MKESKVKMAINKVIDEINIHPFIYRNEADIQSRLYATLCSELNEWDPNHETCFHNLKTNLVHREYFGGGNQRVDLVVFNQDELNQINMNYMKKSGSGNYVKASDAIEIKTEQGSSGQYIRDRVIGDINKLIQLRENNLAENIHFVYIVRWPTKSKVKKLEVKEIAVVANNICKKQNIEFYTNKEEKYFL